MSVGWLDAEAVAATAAELVAHPSVAGAEGPLLDHVATWLDDRGVRVSQQDVPADVLRAHPFHSAEIERERVPVLIARVGGARVGGARVEGAQLAAGRGGGRLLLNAHVDVVPAADQAGWTGDPFVARRVGERLVGRGTADTKGGLAAAMHVLAALADPDGPGADLPGEIVLTPVIGEEDGGAGTLASILVGATDDVDAAVVLEPTDLAVATASAGALCFRVTVSGRAAHGSVRHTGVSAIEKGWLVHRGLLALEADRAARTRHRLYPSLGPAAVPFPLCMGTIAGGDYRCDEAAWLVLEGRYGTAPDEPVAAARAELEACVAAVADADPWLADHRPTVEWIGAQWVGGDTDLAAEIVRAFARVLPRVEPVGVPYGCDLGLLRQVADVPAVVYGPGSADVAHAPDEHVRVGDLGRCAATLHALALDVCGAPT